MAGQEKEDKHQQIANQMTLELVKLLVKHSSPKCLETALL